ncbi:MAG: hypothetical protein H6R18_82 [Proteobacteria bacterium]|nr:hypothetical protein [Pseudomonadota bacterium]
MPEKLKTQRGMTIVELILALGVALMTLILLVNMHKNASDDLKAKRSADYLLTFTQAASRYAAANRDGLVKAMRNDSASQTDFCTSTVNLALSGKTSYTCVTDLARLISKNALPASFAGSTNAYGQTLSAIFKLANPASGSELANGDNQDVEILVVANNGVPITQTSELGLAVELLGGVGGFVPPAGTSGLCPAGKEVCGPGWASTLADFGACRKGVDAGCN